MGLLDKFLGKVNDRFFGNWISDPTDFKAINELGNVKMSCGENGNLTYEIIEDGKSQFIYMTYIIKGNKLITNQPSQPKIEETEFTFEDPKTLVLKFGGLETRYIKVD